MGRTVVWFSCGAASTTAAMLTLKQTPAILVYCDTGGEHPDNWRYMHDVEMALGVSVQVIRNEKYSSHWDVFEKTRWLNGPLGARCTVELKKVPRYDFQREDDIQVFGYTLDEKDRAARLMEAYPEIHASFPLIKYGLKKKDCLGMVKELCIELPVMYKLGFKNNNCLGCVKGGKGYWNHIRKHFPAEFDRMAKLEREIGASCIRDQFLDELPIDAGEKMPVKEIGCDFVCQSVLNQL
jgi:hypothetical protein